MKYGTISRLVQLPEHGTFGAMVLDATPFCMTLEPYLHKIIPAAQYIAVPFKSPTFGDVYLLQNVVGRTYIEMHPGNLDDNTKGCILIAEKWGKLYGKYAQLNSGITFKKFLQYMNNDKLFLTIRDCF